MTATFERYWDYALHVTQWTNALLGPPPGHVLRILGGAQSNDPVAGRFVNGLRRPDGLPELVHGPHQDGRLPRHRLTGHPDGQQSILFPWLRALLIP